MGLSPRVQLRTGSHAGVDVDEQGRLRPHGNRHPEGEIADLPLGMAGVDPAGQHEWLDPELLKASELLLLGPQPTQLRMIEHEIERQQSPPGDFQRGRPAVADGGDLQLPVDLRAEDAANAAAVGDGLRRYRLVGNACPEQRLDKAVGAGLGVSEESLDLVPGEQARVQADQGDPLGLLPGEAKRPQQLFPSLQVRKLRRFLGSADLEKGHQDSLGVPQGRKRGFSWELRFTAKEQEDVPGPIPVGPLYSRGFRSSPVP